MSNTDGEAQQTERCQYELWVNEYFGLPENFPEKATRMDFDYGNLVNMLAMFDVKRNKHHKQNLNDCMNERDLELASFREQLDSQKDRCIDLFEKVSEREEVIRELTSSLIYIVKTLGALTLPQDEPEALAYYEALKAIEKAKSLTTKDR